MAGLIALAASVAGPGTRVVTQGNNESRLNQYIIAVCDPGGGKTATFESLISPVLEMFMEDTSHPLNIETYTIAGIQRHQIDTKGYGLITSDEGSRVLTQINAKQSKCEGEYQLLCKMWGGRGDTSTLMEKERGFKETSMSMCLFTQPALLLEEMSQMGQRKDGFVERFLFLTAKPKRYEQQVLGDYGSRLKEYDQGLFPKIFRHIYTIHNGQSIKYTFGEEADKKFTASANDYAQQFNKQYPSGNVQIYTLTFPNKYNIHTSIIYPGPTFISFRLLILW